MAKQSVIINSSALKAKFSSVLMLSENNLEASCVECKQDLSKDSHLENCSIHLKQVSDKLALDAARAKEESDKIVKQEIENARKTIEENKNIEVEKIKKELRKKNSILKKIHELVPDEQINDDEVLNLSLEQVFDLYKQVLKVVTDERTKGKMEYSVTCPDCSEFIGETRTHDEAVTLLDKHKNEKHPSKYGGWIIATIAFSLLTFAGFMFYKKRKKKNSNCEGCGGEGTQ